MSFIKNNSYSPYIGALLLIVSIASCKVRQDYHQPDLQLPAQFADAYNTDTNSIANLKWDQFFTDPTLQALINKGLAHNYDLQIALKNISTANQQLKQAKTLELPEANLQVTASREYPSDSSLDGITANSFLHQSYIDVYSANIAVSWEADIWGKLHMQKQAALTQYLQTAEAVKAIQTRLISDIAQGYYNLLMLDKQLAVSENNLRLSDTTLLLARLQRDAGNATTLAVEQAEAQRQSTAILIPVLQQNIALQEHALSILVGDMPNAIARSIQLDQVDIPDNLATGIPAAMVSRRPDVHASELALIVANKKVGIAKAGMYPSLNITAEGGVTSFSASYWFNVPAAVFGLFAGTVAQPLFQHRTLKTKYKVAQIQREQSVLQFRQSVLNAVGEVSDALVKEQKLKEQQQLSAARVATLHKAITDAELLFRSDMATYLEVITAQSSALQAELDLANVQKSRLNANIDLYRALGGGRE